MTVWTELDHIVPLHKGGEDTETNLQGLCDQHHRSKTASDMGYRPTHGADQQGNPLAYLPHWDR